MHVSFIFFPTGAFISRATITINDLFLYLFTNGLNYNKVFVSSVFFFVSSEWGA